MDNQSFTGTKNKVHRHRAKQVYFAGTKNKVHGHRAKQVYFAGTKNKVHRHRAKQVYFAGDQKVGESFLGKWEKKFVSKYVGKIPNFIETYHLTLFTILWSLLVVYFGYLSAENIYWLLGVSLMIVFQYITDLFDGAVGRYRKSGFVKWGYHMDHFLDYIFLYSILIAYTFLLSGIDQKVILIGVVMGAFMVNGFLYFAATNKFRITHLGIGPTEIRFGLIIFNTFLIYFGIIFLEFIIPYVLIISFIMLIGIVYKTQRELWFDDLKNKKV